MVQITIQLDDSLVESIGEAQIEQLVQDWLYQYKRKQAPSEAADELLAIDLTNDPQWQVARNLAWSEYKDNFENVA